MNTHEVLVAARNLIDRKGWWPGEGVGGECASTALGVVDRQYRQDSPSVTERYARVEMRRAVGAASLRELFAWNDAPGRTKQEVLDAFDKAISATAPEPADPLEGVDVRGVVAS